MLGVASVFSISVIQALEMQYSSFFSICAIIKLFSVTSRVVIPSRVLTFFSLSPGRNGFTSRRRETPSGAVSCVVQLTGFEKIHEGWHEPLPGRSIAPTPELARRNKASVYQNGRTYEAVSALQARGKRIGG